MRQPMTGSRRGTPRGHSRAAPSAVVLAVVSTAAAAAELPRGEVIPSVACDGRADQSYALYVPTVASRPLPVVYVLDPSARGGAPVEAMRDAAERYGFVVAGSNTSRNGPMQPSLDALQAMWADTHARLPIDDTRVYFAGFSGGARAAARFARACQCTHGVLLNSAGFDGDLKDATFAVFAAVGRADFNYGEMAAFDTRLDDAHVPHVLRRFEGRHRWAPPEVWDEALGWLVVLEMKDGRRPRDAAAAAAALERGLARARAEEAGEPHVAWRDYQALAAAFDGVVDVTAVRARAAAMANTPAVRDSARRDRAGIEKEQALAAGARRALAAMQSPGGDAFTAWRDARRGLEDLRDRLAKEKRLDERRLLERAHAGVSAQVVETGQGFLARKDYPTARRYFELGIVVDPDGTWAHTALARCLAAGGDTKGALRELAEAKRRGATIADLPGRFPELALLASDPTFQALTAADVGH